MRIGLVEGPTAADRSRLEEHDVVHKESVDTYRKLAGVVEGSHIDNALRVAYRDPAKLAEMIHMRETTFPERAKEAAELFAADLQGARESLAASLGPVERKRVFAIIDALQKPIPAKNPSSHIFGAAGGGVNFKRIETEHEFLRSMAGAFPNATNDLLHVDSALNYLKKQDSSYEVWEMQQGRKGNKFDKTANGILKLTGALILTTAAVATGVPAIVEGIKTGKVEFKTVAPPLLFMGVAGLIANPQLRSKIFASADQNMLNDINATLNNPSFRQLTDDYNVRGEGWAKITETIMEKPSDTKTFLAKLKKNGNTTKGIEKETDAYVRKMTRGGEEEEALHAMIEDGRFPDLVHQLSNTSTKEGRGIISDYVRLGAQPFMSEMRADAREINRLPS
jgi:hypothetical protein